MRKPSFRFAILGLFSFIVIFMILLLTLALNSSYDSVSREQAEKVISLMDAAAHTEVVNLLENPKSIGRIYSTFLSKDAIYAYTDFTEVEAVILELTKEIHATVPQITTLGYGDEKGNFIGVRANDNGSFTLMVMDDQTDDRLLIYNGEDRSSEILASYEGYDVKTRPWYSPVRENPVAQWSDIYINMDDLKDATMSSLVPIFDKDDDAFVGVVSVDISLEKINGYLQEIAASADGVMYIINKDGRIISHSTKDPVYRMTENKEEALFLSAEDSSSKIIAESSAYLAEGVLMKEFSIGDEKHYMKISKLGQQAGVDWQLAVVVPERALVGKIRDKFHSMTLWFVLMASLGLVIGTFFLSLFISTMTNIAKRLQTTRLSPENPEPLEVSGIHFAESDYLVQSFNQLFLRLKENIHERNMAQQQLKRMTEDENSRLEKLVEEKTMELQTAMDELVEKEKMASLGSLVSGISHEINTPLGVAVTAVTHMQNLVTGQADMLRSGRLTLNEFNRFIDTLVESTGIICRNLDRAKELVISFKKISVDQSSSLHVRFSILEYVRLTLSSLAHELKVHQVTVMVSGEDATLVQNPGSFAQVLTNLVMNSIIHGFKDQATGEISIDIRSAGSQLHLLYTDNGCGIAPDIMNRVFDPFFTTNRSHGGSGLGLHIVRNIVISQFGGSIQVGSRAEGGVRFTIRIPLDE